MNQYNNRLRANDGIDYALNPNFAMAPAFAELMSHIYKARFGMVNAARTTKLTKDTFCNDIHIFKTEEGSWLGDKLVPCSETMAALKGMTLDDCKQYSKNVDDNCDSYLKACAAFKENPTMANWNQYREHHSLLYAALWMSYFWRIFMKQKSSKCANKKGISSLHYGQMLANMQQRFSCQEKDLVLRKELVDLAHLLKPSLPDAKVTGD